MTLIAAKEHKAAKKMETRITRIKTNFLQKVTEHRKSQKAGGRKMEETMQVSGRRDGKEE